MESLGKVWLPTYTCWGTCSRLLCMFQIERSGVLGYVYTQSGLCASHVYGVVTLCVCMYSVCVCIYLVCAWAYVWSDVCVCMWMHIGVLCAGAYRVSSQDFGSNVLIPFLKVCHILLFCCGGIKVFFQCCDEFILPYMHKLGIIWEQTSYRKDRFLQLKYPLT